MLEVTSGQPFYARCSGFASGLAGTIGVRIIREVDGATELTRTTSGIVESPAGSGRYVATLTAPTTAGDFSVFWDSGSVSPSTTADEDMHVYSNTQWISLKPQSRGAA